MDERKRSFQYITIVEGLNIVTWIGMNDLDKSLDIQGQLTALFEIHDSLYKAGARTFILFTVPPLHRSPYGDFSACVR